MFCGTCRSSAAVRGQLSAGPGLRRGIEFGGTQGAKEIWIELVQ